jgi:hypothetical protein
MPRPILAMLMMATTLDSAPPNHDASPDLRRLYDGRRVSWKLRRILVLPFGQVQASRAAGAAGAADADPRPWVR